MPGSVVLQDELVEILDDYLLTTEMNTALAGKADLQHSHAIADVANLQNALNSKWEWNATQVAGVKVSNAFAADKLASSVRINGTDFNGESDIITAKWGKSRTITVWDFYNVNKQAAQGIDGSADFSLMLPQSIKVKTLNIDGVTLSVVGGRLHVDSTLTADGDLVAYGDGEGSSGGGLDEEAMWAALGGSMSSKVVSASHLPSLSSLSGNLDSSRITGLDSALTSYAKKDGSNATGTWGISISGDAASATWARYITPRQFGNQGTIGALKSSILSAMGDGNLLMYPGQSYITSGGHVSTIMNNWSNDGFSIPAGSQTMLLRLDNYQSSTYGVFLVSGYSGGFYRLLRNSSSTWSGPYILLDAENYHNIADSRYVKKAGDTMTGVLSVEVANGHALSIKTSNQEGYLSVYINSIYRGAVGFNNTHGTFLYNYTAQTYVGLRNDGQLYHGYSGGKYWHSGNDGSGSGLDADLLDGYHESSFLRSRQANNVDFNTLTTSGVYRLSYTTSNGASNGPAGNEWGNMLVLRGGGDTIAQLAFGYVSSDRPMFRQGNPSNVGGAGSWTQWFTLATTLDNVASATKLANSRTLWGRPFDGTGNVSGAISSTGNITPSAAGSYNIGTASLWYERIYGRYIDTASGYNLRLCTGGVERLSIQASSGNVGIGTTSPAYKLDVAGSIRATSGITIGSTDDYGWYNNGGRITAGAGTARGVNVGSLLVSNAWADYTKVPTNGIYSKGDIWTGGKLFIPSSEGNQKYYIRIE